VSIVLVSLKNGIESWGEREGKKGNVFQNPGSQI